MRWSLKLGRILGIDVYVHLTFLLLLGFVGLAHWMTERSLEAALTGLLFFTGLFACVLLHEYGHALAARKYGIATRLILAGSQQDFPVLSKGQVVGMLGHAQLFAALRESGETTTVGVVMRREFALLSPSDPLEAAMAPANVEKGLTMPVQAGDRLVGLLTAENIGEFFMIRSALVNRPRRNPSALPAMAVPPVIAPHHARSAAR